MTTPPDTHHAPARARDGYRCPECASTDRTAYRRCSQPMCPDGRDQVAKITPVSPSTAPASAATFRDVLVEAQRKFQVIADSVRWVDGCIDGHKDTPGALQIFAGDAAKEIERALTPPAASQDSGAFDMRAFAVENRARCEAPNGFNHPMSSWSLSDWMTATLGELGEAANVAKKLNRVRDGITGNSEAPEQLRSNLADEIADAFIYLDLLAQSEGIDLATAVRTKFDKTSAKIGYSK